MAARSVALFRDQWESSERALRGRTRRLLARGQPPWPAAGPDTLCDTADAHVPMTAKSDQTTVADPRPAAGPITLRAATVDDAGALVDLEQRCFRSDRLTRRQFVRHARSASAELRVAMRGTRCLGHLLLFFRRNSPIARLYSIAVAPDARGHGLGARLLDAAEGIAVARGAGTLRLEVRARNRAARRLYESRGYKRIGIERGYYEDGADAWRYQKQL